MSIDWNDKQPIYQQLYQRMVGLILDQILSAGEAMPSVRQVAADYKINHITVSKAYQMLVDQKLLENRRGIGMFIKPQARDILLASEKERFLIEEWPQIKKQIARLGLNTAELLKEKIPKENGGNTNG